MRPFSKYWIITVLVLLASFANMPSTWAETCSCAVTDSCTLPKVIGTGSCSTITFSKAMSGKTLTLDAGVPLKGVSLEGPVDGSGQPTVTLAYGPNMTSDMLIQMSGNASMKNLMLSAPGKTAVQMTGSDNTVTNVAIIDSATGFQLEGSGGLIEKSVIAGATAVGVKITGSHYKLSDNQFTSNALAIQLSATAAQDIFDQNSFTGNKTAINLSGGNSNMPAPIVVRAFQSNDIMTLVVIGLGAGEARVYLADAAEAAQGKTLVGKSSIIPYSSGEFSLSDVYQIDVSSAPKGADLVMIYTHPDLGTSAFSEKINLKAYPKLDVAPPSCLSMPWFVKSMMKLHNKGSYQSVWDDDSDGDTKTNGQEDVNRDCVYPNAMGMGALSGESNPDDKNSVPPSFGFKLPSFPNICGGNPDPCKLDQDNDGIDDAKDNCPEDVNADQKDFDGDSLGNACDLDQDNDGLNDKHEGAAGTLVLSADSDEDGFCDGPAWGAIKNGSPTCKPGDNCPMVKNATQWDDDEDGIGNDCDKSPWASQGGATALVDSDGDVYYDYTTGNQKRDNCPSIANPDQTDSDADTVGDACDSDDDNDGVLDVVENSTRYVIAGNGAIVYKMLNPLSAESDTDPSDNKNDASIDSVDQCPILPGTDSCDLLPGSVLKVTLNDAATDDCPTVKNLGMKGSGGKDVACDSDIDGDGLKNAAEDKLHTHFWEADSDHYKMPFNMISGFTYDLVKDGDDICPTNFNPGSPQPDVCSAAAKAIDTDTDGVPDAKDNCPVIANADQTNMDGDVMGDLCDPDIDDDGIPNDAPDNCPKFKDPSNVCKGANPGVIKDPPLAPPLVPGNSGVMQGGSSCSLVPSAEATAHVLPTVSMFLAPLAAFAFRRRRNPE